MSRAWLVAVALACGAPAAPAAPRATQPDPFPPAAPFRIGHAFEPTEVRARLAIGQRITGHVEIDGDLVGGVSLIWLNGVDLAVTAARAISGTTVVPLQASRPRADQLLGLLAPSPLPAGHWTLAIDYSAPIRAQEQPNGDPPQDPFAVGAFRRTIGADSYVVTQSEAIYARAIFPCIDEPDRKIPWQLTLDVDDVLVAASNASIVRETPLGDHRKRVEFAKTAPLPSYLIAFAVGPFDVVDAGKSAGGVPIRILAEHGHAARVAVAAKRAPELLDRLAAWTGIPYAYGKLDLVDVPHAGWGAMENPGLVTFDDDLLESDAPDYVVAHEFAHLWFGDLVTLAWWDDIWLNESFAVFFGRKLTSDETTTGIDERAQGIAGLESAIAIHHRVDTNLELALDGFTTDKLEWRGAALLQWLEGSLGEARFQRAIRAYLAAHANRNATTRDLEVALDGVADRPIDATLDAVLGGRDVPTIAVTEDCAHGPPRLDVESEPVHVCVAYDRDGARAETCGDIGSANAEVPLPARSCPRWVMPNPRGEGLYRVQWTTALVRPLLDAGWSSLTLDEKRLVYLQSQNWAERVKVFLRFLGDGQPPSSAYDATLLDELAKYVPADLVPAFDAQIGAWFGARVHAAPFQRGTSLYALELVARTGDAVLAQQARPIVARYRDPSTQLGYLEPALLVTAVRDRAFAAALLHDVGGLRNVRITEKVVAALARTPHIADLAAADPYALEIRWRWLVKSLLANVCDPADRATLAAVPAAAPALREIDICVAWKAKLEPLFRAWLGKQRH